MTKFENFWKNWIFHQKMWKNNFFQKFQFFHFFEFQCANFIPNFNLNKSYRHTNPFAWPIFRVEIYPQMNSNQNLNVWTIFKKNFETISFTAVLHTLRRTICLNTVLLFESGWDILLYESLEIKIICVNWFFLIFNWIFHQKMWKNNFFQNF